jgi:hypothetical protein
MYVAFIATLQYPDRTGMSKGAMLGCSGRHSTCFVDVRAVPSTSVAPVLAIFSTIVRSPAQWAIENVRYSAPEDKLCGTSVTGRRRKDSSPLRC